MSPKPFHELLFFYAREFLAVFRKGTRKHGTSIPQPTKQGWALLVCQLSRLGGPLVLSGAVQPVFPLKNIQTQRES